MSRSGVFALALVGALSFAGDSWAGTYAFATFARQSPAVVSGRLARLCLQRGHQILERSADQVVCEIKMGGLSSDLFSLFLLPRGSTDPQLKVRFMMIPNGADTDVQANEWIEAQTAFGQTRRTEVSNDKAMRQLQQQLDDAATPGPSAPADNAVDGGQADKRHL